MKKIMDVTDDPGRQDESWGRPVRCRGCGQRKPRWDWLKYHTERCDKFIQLTKRK